MSNDLGYIRIWTPFHRVSSGHWVFFGFVWFLYRVERRYRNNNIVYPIKNVDKDEFLIENLTQSYIPNLK